MSKRRITDVSPGEIVPFPSPRQRAVDGVNGAWDRSIESYVARLAGADDPRDRVIRVVLDTALPSSALNAIARHAAMLARHGVSLRMLTMGHWVENELVASLGDLLSRAAHDIADNPDLRIYMEPTIRRGFWGQALNVLELFRGPGAPVPPRVNVENSWPVDCSPVRAFDWRRSPGVRETVLLGSFAHWQGNSYDAASPARADKAATPVAHDEPTIAALRRRNVVIAQMAFESLWLTSTPVAQTLMHCDRASKPGVAHGVRMMAAE